jgi:hypothetical protein
MGARCECDEEQPVFRHAMTSTHTSREHEALSVPHATDGPEVHDLEPIVNVGIPTLGDSPYLVESIESVFAQTLPSWRLLISENGPGEESVRRTLEPYLRDPRVRHVVTGERVGRGQNFTNLIRTGDANYVGVLHDDDRWGPGFLERRVAFLEEHKSCGFAFSGYTIIDAGGVARGRTKVRLPSGVHRSATILPKMYQRHLVGTPTVLVRRDAYEAIGSEYKEFLYCDLEMWLRLAAHFDVGFLPVWDADYRIHEAQTSARRTELAQEAFYVLDAVEDLPLPRPLRKKMRAEAHVRSALDAVERGARRESVWHLTQTVHAHALSLVRPAVAARMLAAVAALATGRHGRKALTSVRDRRWHTGGAEGLLTVSDGPNAHGGSHR